MRSRVGICHPEESPSADGDDEGSLYSAGLRNAGILRFALNDTRAAFISDPLNNFFRFRRRLVHNASVKQMDGAVGEARVARVVRHHADRRALTMKLVEELHHRFPVLRVEVPGGLVGEQDGRLAAQRPGNRHALLLAA